MSEWHVVPLGDVCELKRGYDLPNGSRRFGQIPVVSSSGPTGWHDAAKATAPGVVTGRYGTLGQVFYIKEDFWPLNTALYVRDFKGNVPLFVASILRSMNLAQYDGAAAVPGLNRNHLHTIPVRVPDVGTQNAIADVIQAFDDLIENNQRRVELLEEMTRAIYREWLVKFRFPGHEEVPLVDSADGPIPQGWVWGIVNDLANIVKQTVDPLTIDPTTPAVGLEHIPRKQITLNDWGVASSQGSRKGVFAKGDILFGKIRPYFHKVSVAPIDGICSTDAIVIRPSAANWGQVVAVVSSVEFVAHATQTSNGTKMPRADWKVIGNFPLVVPPSSVAESFTSIVREHLGIAETLMFENRKLSAIRDLLVPKLVTGQIDVSTLNFEELVEASVP